MTFSSPLMSRIAAVGLLLVALGALWTLLAEPLLARHQDSRRTAEQSQDLLERYHRIAAERPALEARLDQEAEPDQEIQRFLDGDSPDLVAAGLQDRLRRAVSANGAKLTSMRPLPPEPHEGHVRVTLRINIECPPEALQGLFHGIEAATPYLFLDNVDVRVRRRSVQRQPVSAEPLRVSFDVFGFMRGPNT